MKTKKHKHPRSFKEIEAMGASGTTTGRMLSKAFGYDKDFVRTVRIFMAVSYTHLTLPTICSV